MNYKSSIVSCTGPKLKTFLVVFALVFTILIQYSVAASAQSDASGVVATAAPAQPPFSEMISRMLPMFALVFMIYYFMIIKPQQLKLKNQTDLTTSLKKGDTIVTTGGIFGKVASIDTDSVTVEIAPNVKIKVELSHVSRKVEQDSTSGTSVSSSAVSRIK